MKRVIKKFVLVLLGIMIAGETAVQARTSDFLLGGVVGAITGAAIMSSQQPKCGAAPRHRAAPRHHRKKHHHHKKVLLPLPKR